MPPGPVERTRAGTARGSPGGAAPRADPVQLGQVVTAERGVGTGVGSLPPDRTVGAGDAAGGVLSSTRGAFEVRNRAAISRARSRRTRAGPPPSAFGSVAARSGSCSGSSVVKSSRNAGLPESASHLARDHLDEAVTRVGTAHRPVPPTQLLSRPRFANGM
ncbi:hypothetical protein GCM10018963_06980 [Saccharothrix longispora]